MSYDLPIRRSQAAGSAFTVATLPTLSQMVGEPIGMLAYTSDGGLFAWNGSIWVSAVALLTASNGTPAVTVAGGTQTGFALTTVAITGTAGQFSCDATTLTVGQFVTISGTLGGTGTITGYANPTTYLISATNGSTTFTLVVASTSAAIVTTAGTPTGLTYTVTAPLLNMTETWNNSNVLFTGLKANFTDTASNTSSYLMDLQTNGASKFQFRKDGSVQIAQSLYGGNNAAPRYALDAAGLSLADGRNVGWASAGSFSSFLAASCDVVLGRRGAASLQFGGGDVAVPIAQTIGPQSVIAGTSNGAGQNFTIRGSQGTGTGIGGDIIFQVAPAGTTGTAVNALAQALRIYNDKTVIVGSNYTVATLPIAGTQGRRAWVTDATAPTFGGALVGGGAVVIPVFDNGTAWVSA